MSYAIQDIFRTYYVAPSPGDPVDWQAHRAALAIINCKTPALGGHASTCEDCQHTTIHYNSCRNRHCPCCQGLVKEKWVDQRKAEVVDAPYFHVVFTVPQELHGLIYSNKRMLYDLLYKASADTLMTLAQDEKYLRARIGFMSLLHTWGQSLCFHPHIHSIVLGGGLTKDLKFKVSKDDFLFPVRVVSRLFRGKFMAALKKLYRDGRLVFAGASLPFESPAAFKRLVDLLYSKEWVPHIKETFKGAANVIEYLGRYTHRIAMTNSRIIAADDQGITFRIKDYKHDGVSSQITLSPAEFLRRFLMHVLPKGFVKIRHYGILSNRSKKVKLAICRNAVKRSYPKPMLEGLTAVQIIMVLFGIDVHRCPQCASRNIKRVPIFPKRE